MGQFATPYEGMGNNPVTGSEPTGGYDSWLGAWFASWFGIKGDVSQNLDPTSLNFQQYYYSKSATSVTNDGNSFSVVSGPAHYCNGSDMSQVFKAVDRDIDQYNKQVYYDKHSSVMGLVNPRTGIANGSGAITDVYPIETVIFAVATGGVSTEAQITDEELLKKAATEAENAVGGTGRFAGTAKHTYANNWLQTYQEINEDRGLEFNEYFNNGPGNRVFLDVINRQTMKIYDFKFGDAVMGTTQFTKYSNNFTDFTIQIIRPIK